MRIYTLKEAARHAKIGMDTLKRACEEGLVKATKLPNRTWIIAESALEEALHDGLDLRGLTNTKIKEQKTAARRVKRSAGEKAKRKTVRTSSINKALYPEKRNPMWQKPFVDFFTGRFRLLQRRTL